MSNGNIFERIFKLWTMICKMIMEGTRDPYKVAQVLQSIVDEADSFLRRLFADEAVAVPATAGAKTFANSGFVVGYIHPDYKPSQRSAEAVNTSVHEIVRDGRFTDFLGSPNESRPRWQTECQIVVFCELHRDKLRGDGYATFFELEDGFVANVDVVDGGRLVVRVRRLSDGYVWHAECRHRVVLPQQTL